MRAYGVAAYLLALLMVTPWPAGAWTDASPAGLVTEVQIERDGGATVTQRVRWQVLAGRLRSFELAELPADFTLLEAAATDATGTALMVNARTTASGRLEVSLAEGQSQSHAPGTPRGAVDVVVRYTMSLRAQSAVHRVGDDAVVDLVTIPWERGLEAAELRVALPSSARRARWIADETAGVDATVTSELGRDVIHAMRRHVPAGTRWTARIACDPALFTWLDRPAVARTVARTENQRGWFPALVLAAALAVALALTSWRFSRESGDKNALLVRVGLPSRAVAIALAALGGIAQSLVRFEVAGAVTLGTVLVLVAFTLGIPRARGARIADASVPARLWPDARALATAHGARTREPWAVATTAMLVSTGFGLWAIRHQSVLPGVVAIDAACVAAGALACLRGLVPGRDAGLLRGLSRGLTSRLRRVGVARVAWRVRGDGTLPGSVALRIVPRPGHRLARGVRAIECSMAWHAGAVSWHPLAMVSVRIERGSLLEKNLRLLATRLGCIETSPDGDEIAWIAEMIGPDRPAVLAALEALVAQAVVHAPGQGAEIRARAMLVAAEAHP